MTDPAADLAELTRRITALESLDAIKRLKYRYWRACDAKDPDAFRDCFIRSGASIKFGMMGEYDDAAGLVEVFRRVALSGHDGRHLILDMHHGMHPDITLTGDASATGRWTLRFRQLALAGPGGPAETVAAMEYDDAYVIEDGGWKMAKSHVTQLWTVTRPLPADAVVQEHASLLDLLEGDR